MKRLSIIFILLSLFVTTQYGLGSVFQNNTAFKHLGPEDGLSQSSVWCILQDRQGFMWFGTKDGLNRYDGISFQVFRHINEQPNSIGNNVINALLEDKTGNIWVGTDEGVYIYSPESESFEKFTLKSKGNVGIIKSVGQMELDSQDNIWFLVESQGIFRYDSDTKTLSHFPIWVNHLCIDNEDTIWLIINGKGLFFSDDNLTELKPFIPAGKDKNFFLENDVYKIIAESQNTLYLGTSKEGLKKINILTQEISDLISTTEQGEYIFVRNILNYSDDELLIATENGIYIYNKKDKNYIHITHNPYDPYSLADNAIYDIFKDREGGIWIGSYFGGINYYPPQYTAFEKYYTTNTPGSISGRVVREFCEEENGDIWIGTEDNGLNKFNPATNRFYQYKHPSLYHNIHALCLDGDYLWIGTFSQGLCRLNRKTNELKAYLKNEGRNSLSDNSIFSLLKTSWGDLFIGTYAGLNIYDSGTDSFKNVEELNGVFVFDMHEDSNGHIWLASYREGLFCYNPRKNTWKRYNADTNEPGSLPYNRVISIFEDSRKRLWFGMQGKGFCLFNPVTETFTHYYDNIKFPNDVIYKIIEDKKGFFWITTNEGLIQFNPDKPSQYKQYTTTNGLLNNQFNYKSGLKTKDGKIYFGGIGGFISFDPSTFIENENFPTVAITDFFLFNKKAIVGEKGSPLQKSITYTDKITLNYNQNSFAFHFAGLSYISPEANCLSHMLEGFDKKWSTASNNAVATYTNLSPGNYVFKVRSANNLGNWNEDIRAIEVKIKPPFWKTTLAYCFYATLLIGLISFLVYNFRKRILKKQQLNFEKLNTEKEKEIYQAKIDFFTNIAHEIRTPISLIKAPLENILKDKKLEDHVKEDLVIMEKNTSRLLELTNQLLDFRKTESNRFSLDFVSCNISELIRDICLRFHSVAKENNQAFEIILPKEDFFAPVDKEALTKILSNLFNNAVKYSKSYIQVKLSFDEAKDKDYFFISVLNDGEAIPVKKREEIFKPFVQLKRSGGSPQTGTGLGLALANSLAELHNGKLVLEDNPEYICFTLSIPLKQKHVSNATEEKKEPIEIKSSPIETSRNSPTTLLVVEDNIEMASFLVRQFKESYHVLHAENGLQALKVIEEASVDIIVSDVMMPEMDGFELCKRVKSDLSYSHIPLILLTAKASLQSKIEGIELGADDYIEKPFSVDYLMARISNLLQAQEKLRKAFTSSPFVEAKTIALSKADESFLEKLTLVIQKNMAELDFNVDILADEMNMSRSSLHRKIKGITKITPNEYIQLERLKMSAQLIKSGEYRINEICYLVGFNSSSYFAKCFQKQFGVLPKDFCK